MEPKIATDTLRDVPETLLLPLYNRAVESQRPDAILRDERAMDLVQRLDYDFSRFGPGHVSHPIRARVMDDILTAFLARHPDAVVMNLGAGLDTAFERVDNGSVRWYEVDLPESIALRRQFFEASDRYRFIEGSALDFAWMDLVLPDTPLMVLAAGLLMYFTEADVKRLITTLAARFPGAEMQFDTITRHFSAQSLAGKAQMPEGSFTLPPMPWGINTNEIDRIAAWHPAITVVQVRDYTVGYRRRWGVYGYLALLPPLRNRFVSALVHLRFGPPPT
jgi:O-methyltransferase involved in polyketide biosynthesis